MKMPNITPGRWAVEIEGVLTPKVVQSDGYGVCHTSYAPTRAMENATAIAALPDLLEALIDADTGFEAEGYEPDGPTRGPIRAALLKAGCIDA